MSREKILLVEDDEVDEMNRKVLKVVYHTIREMPEPAEALIFTLPATRHLERTADHATNIAEDVVYKVEGDIIRHQTEDFSGDNMLIREKWTKETKNTR